MACDAQAILVSVTHNAVSLGIATGYTFREEVTFLEVPGEGSVGSDCVSVIRRRLVATVRFLKKGVSAVGTVGALVATQKDGDGNSILDTLASMVAGSHGKSVDRNSPPFEYEQEFVNKSSFASEQVS